MPGEVLELAPVTTLLVTLFTVTCTEAVPEIPVGTWKLTCAGST